MAGKFRTVQSSDTKDKAGQIVDVDTLHDDDNRTGPLVIQARYDSVEEPLVGGYPLRFRQCIDGLEWNVDNDEIAAAAGQRAAGGGCKPKPPLGDLDLRLAVLVWPDAGVWKQGPVPWRGQNCPKVVGELVRQFARVTCAYDPMCRLLPEHKGRECHGGGDWFERAWRHVDDQPGDLATARALELIGEGVEKPAGDEGLIWRMGLKGLADKRPEILAQDGPQKRRIVGGVHPLISRLNLRPISALPGLDRRGLRYLSNAACEDLCQIILDDPAISGLQVRRHERRLGAFLVASPEGEQSMSGSDVAAGGTVHEVANDDLLRRQSGSRLARVRRLPAKSPVSLHPKGPRPRLTTRQNRGRRIGSRSK